MQPFKKIMLTLAAVMGLTTVVPSGAADRPVVEVDSLAGLAEAAKGNGQVITMKPGHYALMDFIPLDSLPERRTRKEWPFMVFPGNGNEFRLNGVVIELDTRLRQELRPPVHTNEFVITGNGNVLEGLTLIHSGNGVSPGGAAVEVAGEGNTLKGWKLEVRGSRPYGYGDLFGKGGGAVIPHMKESGLLITGHRTRLESCHLKMRSFGHGIFLQKDAAEVVIDHCRVEGEMRRTGDMLAETSGPAFEAGFRTMGMNRNGEFKILPGYMKSLCEDGFRTYGKHPNLVIRGCTAENMRGGFEIRSEAGALLEDCTARGNERGFWTGGGTTVRNCRGDVSHGPLLFVEGKGASVELEVLAGKDESMVHALALISGENHQIILRGGEAGRGLPIMTGFGTPPAGEGMGAIPARAARNVRITNHTGSPVWQGRQASGGNIDSTGPVLPAPVEVELVPGKKS